MNGKSEEHDLVLKGLSRQDVFEGSTVEGRLYNGAHVFVESSTLRGCVVSHIPEICYEAT